MKAVTIIELSPGNFVVSPQKLPADMSEVSVGPDSFVSTQLGNNYTYDETTVLNRVKEYFTPKEQTQTPLTPTFNCAILPSRSAKRTDRVTLTLR